MTATGLIVTIYLAWEIKAPAPSADRENNAVRLINALEKQKWIVKALGANLDQWTYY